jgi:hypothetical protein
MLSNFTPLVAKFLMNLDQHVVLLVVPASLLDGWVQMVVPALPNLPTNATRNLCRDARPLRVALHDACSAIHKAASILITNHGNTLVQHTLVQHTPDHGILFFGPETLANTGLQPLLPPI